MFIRNRMVFEAEGAGGGGGNTKTFSADFVQRLQEELATAKAAATDAQSKLRDEVARLTGEHTTALTALKTAHETAVADLTRTHTEALTAAKTEGETALTAAQQAAKQRIVSMALRAEAATLGMIDMDGLKLLDPAEIAKLDVDDSGAVAGAKPLLEAVKKAKAYLFGQGQTSNPNQPPTNKLPGPKLAKDMTDAEFEQAKQDRAWRSAA